MAVSKSDRLYEEISEAVDELAVELYHGNKDKAFRHWAFSEFFIQDDFGDEDIAEKTAIDGSDDFEIDGYHVDEEQKTIHLYQCKHLKPGTSIGDDPLSIFLDARKKLLDPVLVSRAANPEVKELHDYLVNLIPQDYLLHFVWVTSGNMSSQAKKYAERFGRLEENITVIGIECTLKISFEALDLRDLIALYHVHQESEFLTQPQVKIQTDQKHLHEVISDYHTLEMTVQASEVIKIFRDQRYKILRLNPRGPLANKVNREVKESIENEVKRRIFHLLNNGITAICDSYKHLPDGVIAADNFQIVNGCQTTVTLWNTRALIERDPQVLVNLKLIECPEHLHKLIAKTTNTQTPLRAEDFVSTDPLHGTTLQPQFSTLSWFYEVKRGEWGHMTSKVTRERFREDNGGFRRLKLKDVAQAVVAFLGFPGEAKDQIRSLFEGTLSSGHDELSYKDLYNKDTRAIQLLLPALVQRRVIAAVAGDMGSPDIVEAEREWLSYGRLHLVWLVGEMVRMRYQMDGRKLLPVDRSGALYGSMDHWFQGLYGTSKIALRNSVKLAKDRDTYRGPREFFRSSGNYGLVRDNLLNALEMAKDFGSGNPLNLLP